MKQISTYRRPILATIAASALLLGGAAMPKIWLQSPTLLYVAGQAHMLVGDQEGGLRLIGAAAALKSPATTTATKPAVKTCQIDAKPAAPAKNATQRVIASSTEPTTSGHKQWFVFRQGKPQPEAFVQLAALQNFGADGFNSDEFKREIRRANAEQNRAQLEAARETVAHVKADLERRGVPMPASFNVAVPQPPAVPITNP